MDYRITSGHTPATFTQRIDALVEKVRDIGGRYDTDAPELAEVLADDLTVVARAVKELAGLVGVLADLTGERTATERVQAVEAAHAKERFARLALAAVAEEFPCTFPKAWSGHDNINDAIEPDDVPDEFVAKLIERVERQQARRRTSA